MAIQTRIVNGSYTEIYVGGGNFITEAAPTNRHHKWKQRLLEAGETLANFREVTAAEWAQIEAADAAWVEPPQWFIDMWNSACGIYGKYNAATGYFELNGLVDITYKEAVLIYANRRHLSLESHGYYAQSHIRTNLLPWSTNGFFGYSRGLDYAFANCAKLEVARINNDGTNMVVQSSMLRTFINDTKLRKILGILNAQQLTSFTQTFEGCSQLQDIQIKNLKCALSFSDSPLLSLDSLSYLVAQSAASKPITVTVHPEVYAKLADASNTEWHPLMAQATAKQITFATTE